MRAQAARPKRTDYARAAGAGAGARLEAVVARAYVKRLRDAYWLAEPLEWQVANARQVAIAQARIGDPVPSVVADFDPHSNATRVSVFTPDREGLFYRICAGLAAAGANIIDARVHTTRDGMALDNLLVLEAGPGVCHRRRPAGWFGRSKRRSPGQAPRLSAAPGPIRAEPSASPRRW